MAQTSRTVPTVLLTAKQLPWKFQAPLAFIASKAFKADPSYLRAERGQRQPSDEV
jgi:hypothetical protein